MKHNNKVFCETTLEKLSRDKKGESNSSTICDTFIDPENNAFKFRCNYENQSYKKHIYEYESNLTSSLVASKPNPISIQISPTKKTYSQLLSTIRSCAMSGSLLLNTLVHKSMNQKNCTPNSSISNHPPMKNL